MITAQEVANVLEAVAVLGIFVSTVFWVIRSVRLDALRQKLFLLRDEMFDYAAAGNVSFDDPAYFLLRDQMNGLIRYAHQLTLFRLLMSVCMRNMADEVSGVSWNAEWQKALLGVADHSVRCSLTQFHERAVHNALKHLVTGSPLLLLATVASMISMLLRHAGRVSFIGLRQFAQIAARKILIGPLDPRKLEDDAVFLTHTAPIPS